MSTWLKKQSHRGFYRITCGLGAMQDRSAWSLNPEPKRRQIGLLGYCTQLKYLRILGKSAFVGIDEIDRNALVSYQSTRERTVFRYFSFQVLLISFLNLKHGSKITCWFRVRLGFHNYLLGRPIAKSCAGLVHRQDIYLCKVDMWRTGSSPRDFFRNVLGYH